MRNFTAYELTNNGGLSSSEAKEMQARYFGNSAKFWLGLQDDYDIEEEEKTGAAELDEIRRFESQNVA